MKTTLVRPLAFFASIILATLPAVPAPAQDGPPTFDQPLSERRLSELFPALSDEQLAQMKNEGTFLEYFDGEVSVRYAPTSEQAETISEALTRIEPRLGLEALFATPMPENLAAERDKPLALFRILTSVSTMEGIDYYSNSRGRMRLLFRDSYVIEGPDENERIPDPSYNSVPNEETLFIYQRDTSFGRNRLRAEYFYDEGRFLVRMTNLTTMIYGIIPAIRPENMVIHLSIGIEDDDLTFYANGAVQSANPGLFEERLKNSFYYRIEALYRWFIDQIEIQLG
jgi:hypothetical protein